MLHSAEETFAVSKDPGGSDPRKAHREAFAVTRRNRWVLRAGRALGAEEFLGSRTLILGDANLASLPAPFLLKGVRQAAERLAAAMEASEPIIVFGDYDVDGTTSAAMLRKFFREIGHPIDVYIPERLVEGYGLNPTGLLNIREKYASQGRLVVVTVDNGIAAVEACRVARELGIDVIVTDHHDLPPILPDAHCIVNPKQEGCTFPYRMLAGVGVAFYVMAGLRALLRERGHAGAAKVNLRKSLDFVALGTIADLAPLDGVNHTLCRIGLEVMYEHVVSGVRPGVAALLRLAGWSADVGRVDATDVGFKIGPRLNAAGRLGNALATEELLSTDEPGRAAELAECLHVENAERQRLEKEITAQALSQIARMGGFEGGSPGVMRAAEAALSEGGAEAPAPLTLPSAFVLHHDDWHTGVVGIVASRVLEKFYRPTLVLGTLDGKAKGSGRSTHAFDLFGALGEARAEFHAFGGHFHAVGLSLPHDKLPWLAAFLDRKARDLIDGHDTLHPLEIDGAVSLATLDEGFLGALAALEPYGVRNPRPKWLIPHATIGHIKRVGKTPDSNHARVTFRDASCEQAVIAFGMAKELEDGARDHRYFHLVVEGRLQLFRGRWKPELRLVDFSPVLDGTP